MTGGTGFSILMSISTYSWRSSYDPTTVVYLEIRATMVMDSMNERPFFIS